MWPMHRGMVFSHRDERSCVAFGEMDATGDNHTKLRNTNVVCLLAAVVPA